MTASYRAALGDVLAWGALLTQHEERLRRMVVFRMDARLRGRIGASDVLQEAYLEAAAHREDFFRQQAIPFFVAARNRRQ